MKKRTLWNIIFHPKELKKQKEEYLRAKSLVGFGPETLQFVNGAKDLNDLLKAHKIAWVRGYRNSNLGPCSYGMFRTKDISEMKPEEVFLGNIYGLWTFNIPYWNKIKDNTMAGNSYNLPKDTKCYDLIMTQYRGLLKSNIKAIISKSERFIVEYNSNR